MRDRSASFRALWSIHSTVFDCITALKVVLLILTELRKYSLLKTTFAVPLRSMTIVKCDG